MCINRNAIIQREASEATGLMFKDRQAKDSAWISCNSFTECVCVYVCEETNVSHKRVEKEKEEERVRKGQTCNKVRRKAEEEKARKTSAFPPQLKLNTYSFHLIHRPHTAASYHTHTNTLAHTIMRADAKQRQGSNYETPYTNTTY